MTAPGDFTAGDVLQASDMNALPGGIIGEDAKTTNVIISTSPSEVTAITVPVVAGRAYLIGFTCRNMRVDQSDTIIDFELNVTGGATLTQFRKYLANTTARDSLTMVFIDNPSSSATNEYTIDVETSTGTGTLFCDIYDAQMWVQDLGLSA
jgi:hypothetical protein